MASTINNGPIITDDSSSTLRPRSSAHERSNSLRRKASIDSQTGQPYHYDHRRHHHHDPTKGRSPSPPESLQRTTATDQPLYRYNADGILVPVQRTVEQSWSSFLIQHQLVLSCSIIAAVLAAHALIISNEIRNGHKVDWIASLTAFIPPPLWQRMPLSWTRATLGGPAIVKKWAMKPGAYNPNEAWSSLAMALQYQEIIVDGLTGEKQVLYGKGWNDLYMVAVWVMIWTALREAAMTFVFIPLGRHFGVGDRNKKNVRKTTQTANTEKKLGTKGTVTETVLNNKVQNMQQIYAREGKLLRFAEQGWLVLYDGCMWTFGIYLLYHSQYLTDTTYYWRDYPKTHLDATMKWYYLIQFAFWLQQLLLAILGIEKRRKDFLEYMIHHIITCLLIGFSYSFNLTSVGHAVLCSMDFSDIVLAACKMLKYMHKDQLADIGFVFFVFTWVLTRHYCYGVIIWSCFVEAPKYATMIWDPSKGMYFTPRILQGFQVLLCSLYTVLMFWLAMIIRVVMKVLRGENSEDVRSEVEDEDEYEFDEKVTSPEEQALIQEAREKHFFDVPAPQSNNAIST
ncbi:sphingosine N-acyltransferase lag1 [Lobosporangium transversale]|uniref:TLC domain-domain-containing protein n=1 Tax=Lobosporangium transversale TaxID=64571 RepID=A0A1Y2H547_9FUNG|nr:TLC domain-domain-containing protein [Lobosporangium transversale]KAF9918257.1 sphingosine N-acyltransferase lag1 [Lobosporangium transversale]ORZ28162.1 TLC domain-domain-containing protein [Lobosporangium transversale]|eukprot:XP_021885847.1 TLC domain-domain-containing protein [Lobosporangium transversale]